MRISDWSSDVCSSDPQNEIFKNVRSGHIKEGGHGFAQSFFFGHIFCRDDDLLGIYRADIIEAHSVAASILELDDGRHDLVEFFEGLRGEKFIAQHADRWQERREGKECVGTVREGG